MLGGLYNLYSSNRNYLPCACQREFFAVIGITGAVKYMQLRIICIKKKRARGWFKKGTGRLSFWQNSLGLIDESFHGRRDWKQDDRNTLTIMLMMMEQGNNEIFYGPIDSFQHRAFLSVLALTTVVQAGFCSAE